jgi:hypothetical protein
VALRGLAVTASHRVDGLLMYFFVLYPAALALAAPLILLMLPPLSICSGIIRGAKRGFT